MINVIIGKTQAQHEIDFDALPVTSQDFVKAYGLRQLLNDAHAMVTVGYCAEHKVDLAAEVTRRVDEKLSALMEGTITQRASGSRLPPLEAEIRRLARIEVVSAIKAKGFSVKAIGAEKVDSLVIAHSQKNRERFEEVAQANLDSVKSAPTVDLESLGF